jgi:hypothetical protein
MIITMDHRILDLLCYLDLLVGGEENKMQKITDDDDPRIFLGITEVL